MGSNHSRTAVRPIFGRWFSVSFTQKVLLWCGVLVALSFFSIFLLFRTMNEFANIASSMVNAGHANVVQADVVLSRLAILSEKRNRLESAGMAAQSAFRSEVEDLARQIDEFVAQRPGLRTDWVRVTSGIRGVLADDMVVPGQEDLNEWGRLAREAKAIGLKEIEYQVRQLEGVATEARSIAQDRLVLAGAIGIVGSLLITWVLHGALLRLRKAIKMVAEKRKFEPISVMTSDELAEIAVAFNEMASQLEREEAMRSDFISMLSHEIRTPLTSVQEVINLLREEVLGPVTERQQGMLDVAGREVRRLGRLLEQLMNVSRLETDDLSIQAVPVDCSLLVQDCRERIEPLSLARHVTLTALPVAKPAIAKADYNHIRQVLLNLLHNAIRFAPKGTEITIRILCDDSRDMIVLCVSDHGPGIDPTDAPYVFGKYYRGEAARSHGAGLGLGLHISRRIVQAHGGEIWVEPVDGGGACFCFSVPKNFDDADRRGLKRDHVQV